MGSGVPLDLAMKAPLHRPSVTFMLGSVPFYNGRSTGSHLLSLTSACLWLGLSYSLWNRYNENNASLSQFLHPLHRTPCVAFASSYFPFISLDLGSYLWLTCFLVTAHYL